MNFISKLISRSPSAEKHLVTVSPGEFSIVRQEDSPKGRRELIFKEAEICLAKTTREFFVQIQVHDLNNEESKQSSDEGELDDLEVVADTTYLVHSDIKLGYYATNGRIAITWQDLEGDKGDRFEFLCEETVTSAALEKFDRIACEAQYGQKYGKSVPKDAPESLFEEFTYTYDQSELARIAAKPEAANTEPQSGEKSEIKSENHDLSTGLVMKSAKCDLCIYDSNRGVFISPANFQGSEVVLLDQSDYTYFLEVRKDKSAIMGIPIDSEFSPFIDLMHNSFIFNYEIPSSSAIVSYLLRFSDKESLQGFDGSVTIAKYEATHRQRWESVPTETRDYLTDAMTGLTMDTSEPYEQLSDEDEEDDRDEDIELDSADPTAQLGERNSALEVGHTNDRTFVVRGNKIGVFKNTDRNLEYSTTINSVDFDPSRIMLHEQDRALVLQSKSDDNTLFRMDLETGKIVDEWQTGKEVVDFNPISKFAQTTAEQNLYGVAKQSIFRIDPRVNGGKVSSDSEKAYKTGNMGLSNIVTTEAGWMVVGNNKGELRLYNQLGKNAMTLIPGLGDPFVGLDVSSDGKFVLATCAKYLLLLETSTATNNGFTAKWSKDSRPVPRKLQISPENVAYMHMQTKQPISFTPAKFNTSTNSKETTIVTSTGSYLVTWNLRSVMKGEPNSYRIKSYDSMITANNFKFGTDQRVILALEDDVNMVAKSALRSPDAVFKRN